MPDCVIRARIEPGLKAEATAVLKDLGLTPSEAIRLFLHHVADERCLPFPLKAPNDATLDALRELRAGQCVGCCQSVDGLFAELCEGED
jgi:DNA-damage-inducible protein J